ncbi:MAG: DinB family protein [Gemmatimonadales bacterium]
MHQRMEAVEGNLIVLEQAVEALRVLDDATYATGGAAPGVSPIGVHFRHVFDHYQAFLAGLDAGEIDYDARARQGPLETDRALALATVLGFLTDVERLPASLGPRQIRVTMRSVAGHGEVPDWSESTVKRELQFLVSHTVHHYALIKELLRRAEVEVGDSFGVAPSTLAALRRDAACAR